MRRWIIIMLLLVYPFQVALAVADKCCVTTPAGLTHHGAEQDRATFAAPAVFVADDGHGALSDPHCAACVFGHIIYLPSGSIDLPAAPHHVERTAFALPSPTAPPRGRLERPKWPTAADRRADS
jgi:hypothetical protein